MLKNFLKGALLILSAITGLEAVDRRVIQIYQPTGRFAGNFFTYDNAPVPGQRYRTAFASTGKFNIDLDQVPNAQTAFDFLKGFFPFLREDQTNYAVILSDGSLVILVDATDVLPESFMGPGRRYFVKRTLFSIAGQGRFNEVIGNRLQQPIIEALKELKGEAIPAHGAPLRSRGVAAALATRTPMLASPAAAPLAARPLEMAAAADAPGYESPFAAAAAAAPMFLPPAPAPAAAAIATPGLAPVGSTRYTKAELVGMVSPIGQWRGDYSSERDRRRMIEFLSSFCNIISVSGGLAWTEMKAPGAQDWLDGLREDAGLDAIVYNFDRFSIPARLLKRMVANSKIFINGDLFDTPETFLRLCEAFNQAQDQTPIFQEESALQGGPKGGIATRALITDDERNRLERGLKSIHRNAGNPDALSFSSIAACCRTDVVFVDYWDRNAGALATPEFRTGSFGEREVPVSVFSIAGLNKAYGADFIKRAEPKLRSAFFEQIYRMLLRSVKASGIRVISMLAVSCGAFCNGDRPFVAENFNALAKVINEPEPIPSMHSFSIPLNMAAFGMIQLEEAQPQPF